VAPRASCKSHGGSAGHGRRNTNRRTDGVWEMTMSVKSVNTGRAPRNMMAAAGGPRRTLDETRWAHCGEQRPSYKHNKAWPSEWIACLWCISPAAPQFQVRQGEQTGFDEHGAWPDEMRGPVCLCVCLSGQRRRRAHQQVTPRLAGRGQVCSGGQVVGK
jgi:hypothetical protein